MNKCPITKKDCTGDRCPIWYVLDDYEGCPFDLANEAIKDFGATVAKPAARKLDQLLRKYLESRGR